MTLSQFTVLRILMRYSHSMTGAIIMMVAYGHQVKSVDDPFIAMNEAVREHAEEHPGVALVDVFPIRRRRAYPTGLPRDAKFWYL